MNVLSLFSGIGGLDLGLQRAGMTIAGQVEIDPWCRKILAKHWPEVPRHDDVRTAVSWWRSATRPPLDLVCGGFPCQPVSSAGKRLAQDDPRWLWPAMADTIRQLRPAYALMENVPGLLVRGMGDVLGDLASLGYDAEWDCVSAADIGAPHLRKRIWIMAHIQGRGSQPELTGSPDGGEFAAPWADAERIGERPGVGTGSRTVTGDLAAGVRELGRGPTMADATSGDVADPAKPERRAAQSQGLAPTGWRTPESRERNRGSRPGGDWWAAEPGVGRVAHGIPRRVDRLRGLGNAVVPQVAEHIGRLIMEAAA